MAEGFKVADAFVEVTTKDETAAGLSSMKGKLVGWAAGLGLGALITQGITQGLDIRAGNAKLGAQLDLTKAQAEAAGKVAGTVYSQNFGGSLDEVRTAVQAVGTNLVDLSKESPARVEKLTKAAQGLADTFGVDVNESTRQAAALVRNGLAPDFESAFDVITKGYQKGLNAAGDFGDTITEYSPQFSKLGIDGPHALSLLSAGLKAGARDTDVIADAFKEFSIRSINGTKLTAEGFKLAGLDAKAMATEIGKGGPAAQAATMKTLAALNSIKDPVKRNTAGVALFGTQWEDTVRTILPALANAKTGMEGVEGSTEEMNAAVGEGANPVESMKRQMEGWVQSATQLPGPLGATSSGIAAMGTQGIIAAAAVGQLVPSLGGVASSAASTAGSVVSAGARMVGSAVATTASFVAQMVVQGAKWVWLGAQATAQAARMAAAWFIALGPVGWVTAAIIALVVLIIAKWDWVSARTKAIWNAIWGWLKGVWGSITSTVSGAATSVANKVSGVWNSIKSTTSSVWNSITSFVSGIPGRILSFFLRWTLAGIIINHFGSIKSGVSNKVGDLIGFVRGIPGRILSGLGNLGSLLWNAGTRIIQGLIDGIQAKIGALQSKLQSVTKYIPDWKGPMDVDARLLEPSGEAIMDSLTRGLDRGIGGVKSTLGAVTDAIPGMLGAQPAYAGAGVGSAPGAGTMGGDTYHIGTVEIRAEDVREFVDVVDFFGKVKQEARRLAPGGARRG